MGVLAILIIVTFIITFLVAIVVNIITNKTTRKSLEEVSSQVAKVATNEKQKRLKLFHKIYNIPQDKEVFSIYDDFFSTSPMELTEHEKRIAYDILESKLFSRYAIFLDYYIKMPNKKISQIDIITVNKYGVFVFESKDYNGWIFGNGKSASWAQNCYGNKYYFYNPIKQNENHIKLLRKIINKQTRVHSLIIFGDGATLKNINYIPKDTYVISGQRFMDAMHDILSKQQECLTDSEVVDICRKLNDERVFATKELRNEHVGQIHENITGDNRLYS